MARDSLGKDAIKAFLGDDTEFKGLLHFEGTVRIDGRFEGEIETKDTLIVGEQALVQAELRVGSVMVQGRVEGNIFASEKLHITNKGRVVGNITAPALHIEDGALLEGVVSMMKQNPQKQIVQPQSSEPAFAMVDPASSPSTDSDPTVKIESGKKKNRPKSNDAE